MDRASLVRAIEELDPNKTIISVDLGKNRIKYSDKIKQHRAINYIQGDEEIVRAYYVVKLVKELGYKEEAIELEKGYEAGRPKTIKPRIDIILKDKTRTQERTFLFIEVKSPDKFETDKKFIKTQLFELSKLEDKASPINYLVYCTADCKDGLVKEENIIIDYNVYSDYEVWDEIGRLALDELPKDYGEATKYKYIKGEKELDTTITKGKFDLLRKDLHDVLWGGGGTNYNEIFVDLVKIFLAKIYDENNTELGEPYGFQIEFKAGKPETSEKVFERINNLYKSGCKSYLNLSDEKVKKESLNERSITTNKVRYVVEQLQGISLTRNEARGEDILGGFFEAIITEGFKQDKGQFFTHMNLVKFMVYALGIDDNAIDKLNNSKTLPYVCDPACGSGTFLLEVMRVITDTIKRRRTDEVSTADDVRKFISYKMPDVKENTWAWDYLYGIEINPDLSLAVKVNMVLHGDGSANIFCSDALLPFNKYESKEKVSLLGIAKEKGDSSYSKEVNENFDFLISNPPFSIKLDKETKNSLPRTFEFSKNSSSENLFIERYYQLLREGGKVGVVLPESVFDTAKNRNIRLFIFKYFKIKYIVSLPAGKYGAFLPFTPIKTNLLFLEKKYKSEVKAYENAWKEALVEYSSLKRRVNRAIRRGEDTNKAKDVIKAYLGNYLPEEEINLTFNEIIDKHKEDIEEINKNPEWWVFNRVSNDFDYGILIGHTRFIGYHRTVNREFKRENKLFSVGPDGRVKIDVSNPSTILDYIKSGVPVNEPDLCIINFSDISRNINLRLDHKFFKYTFFEEDRILSSFKKKPFLLREGLISIRNGKDLKGEFYSIDAKGAIVETPYKYLTVNNITPNGLLLEDLINIVPKKGIYLLKYRLRKADMIVTRSGTVGVSQIFDLENDEIFYIPSGYLIILKLKEDIIVPEFLEYYLNSDIMKKYFSVFGTGKTQKNIAQGDIKRIPFPSFSKKEQEHFAREAAGKTEALLSEIRDKENDIEVLTEKIKRIIPNFVLTKPVPFDIPD